jgi:hypothetical protein
MSGCHALRTFALRNDQCPRQGLSGACTCVRHIHEPSLSHRGVRTIEGVDVWPLRAASIAVEASAADVPDNRPLSGRFTGRVLCRETGQQLPDGAREHWLVDGDGGPSRSDDDVTVNGNSLYRFG